MARHEELTADANLHFPKGFAGASNNQYPVKFASGTMEWFNRDRLPIGITTASSIVAPPTETAGAVYLLGNESGTLTVSVIAWQSATTVRYTFSGSPDLSAHAALDYLIVVTAVDTDHNGSFIISAVNDGADWIEITNANITDATQDETTGATGTVTLANWDGAEQNSWARFNGLIWEFIVPTEGYQCYLTTLSALYEFDGTDWVTGTAAYDTWAEILANTGGNTSGGTDVIMTSGDTLNFSNSSYTADITEPTLAGNIVLTLPSATGTLALTSGLAAHGLTEALAINAVSGGYSLTMDTGDLLIITDNVSDGIVYDAGTGLTNSTNFTYDGTDVTLTAGQLYVDGKKHFRIPHQSIPNAKLIYTSVEADRAIVEVIGRTTERRVALPEEWKWLVDADTIEVFVSPRGNFEKHTAEIEGDDIIFFSTGDINCSYSIKGERKDVEKTNKVEYGDDLGK